MLETWVYLAIAAAILFGLGDFIVVYSEKENMNIITLYALYTISIGILNLLYLTFVSKDAINTIKKFKFNDWSVVFALCLTYFFAYILHFIAIQTATNPGYANALVMFHVVVLTGLSTLLLDKPLSSRATIGIGIMFIGAYFVSVNRGS